MLYAGFRRLSLVSSILLLILGVGGIFQAVVYGPDDRLDYYQTTTPKKLATESVVALVHDSDLVVIDPNTYALTTTTLQDYWTLLGQPLCPDEPYLTQPTAGFCSGFMVGEDLIATAGHCITNSTDCAQTSFVFGYRMEDAVTPVTVIPTDDVYHCSSIVDRVESGTNDWAVIRVDRPIVGHTPLPLRHTGFVESDLEVADLVVIGHPYGLPAKIAGGAEVKGSFPDYFETNLDAFAGNSGSGVISFDSSGNVIAAEGVLVRGWDEFTYDGVEGCYRTLQCSDETGCAGSWETVTRSTNFAHLVPLTGVPIPAVSSWAFGLLLLLVLGSAAIILRRRHSRKLTGKP